MIAEYFIINKEINKRKNVSIIINKFIPKYSYYIK